ncbi:amino acid dehydrogenase [Moraxella caviae]|uniref:Amino acid dehydrogenase n=1 Tax=Moraxella caviae TaxID=34060 RepID=A0A1S9ZWJ2_9GAMM|nr:FAD-binding oxidoreductase [Moraxella caviae]OOR87797.1 amino acid dehydrogenase [Moraxella caviae]STZ10553.1 Glycine oxidase [Moraxella caviae]VEW12975.1 Glycine oxidase [Moraxella caviae]
MGVAVPKSVVIGGGIVGICCALALQKQGHHVSVIDPKVAGDSTAKWSCGQLAIGEVVPLSKKGILKKLPFWLMNQQGPLALRPSALLPNMPWFMRFLACANTQKINDIATELSTLTSRVYQDYHNLLDGDEKQLFNCNPVLELFDSAADIEAEKEYLALRQRLGFSYQVLDKSGIHDCEPAFAKRFNHALLFDDWSAVRDTEGFIKALTERFLAKGGERILDEACELIIQDAKVSGVRLGDGRTLAADFVVLAAGTGAKRFFDVLSICAPLASVAGYQVILPKPNVQLKHSVIYFNGGFAMTPMTRGLQIGGTIEFANADAPPNFARANIILNKAQKLLPELNTHEHEFGVGYRPFLPDTKPIIDISKRFGNVALAFGHGQLGLTLGATTGILVAQKLCATLRHDNQSCDENSVDLTPFRADRF